MTTGAGYIATPRRNNLTRAIAIALVAGIAAGYACHLLLSPSAADQVAKYFQIGADVFLRLIKMIIAPLVFSTIVSGIASLGSGAAVGRIAGKSLSWFVIASLVSLGLGLTLANLLEPGVGMSLAHAAGAASAELPQASFNVRDFILHIFPASVVQAMAGNEVLQILVFSVFFGSALNCSGGSASRIGPFVDELLQVMLRITNVVMRVAPLGVFGAMAAVITIHGPTMLITYGKFVSTFYVALAALWLILIGTGALFLGRRVITLLKLLREPLLLAFSTSSSEAAFPKMIEQLSAFGVRPRLSGVVLPLGYSFNADGSMIYQAFATIFIAQAYGISISLGHQIVLLLLMLLTSKGIAGVPRASLVVVAATLPLSGLPPEGLLLIIGIDQLLDMGRAMTNVIGNGIATAVIARWEGELDLTGAPVADAAVQCDPNSPVVGIASLTTRSAAVQPTISSSTYGSNSASDSHNAFRQEVD